MATKFLFMLAAALLSAPAAFAEVHTPEAYKRLTAVPMAPGKAPRLVNGMSDLSNRENRHLESLPMQLEGAVRKVKKAKYAPQGEVQRVKKMQKKSKRKSLPRNTARDSNTAEF